MDNFLQVSFVDEECDRINLNDLSYKAPDGDGNRNRTKIYERILSTLRKGIKIGDKTFEVLAFSKNLLQERSLWMYASNCKPMILETGCGIRRLRNISPTISSMMIVWK